VHIPNSPTVHRALASSVAAAATPAAAHPRTMPICCRFPRDNREKAEAAAIKQFLLGPVGHRARGCGSSWLDGSFREDSARARHARRIAGIFF
jgi:hypothetical protein